MIFEESLSVFQSMAMMILVATVIFIWRFYLFKKRHFNKLIRLPSIVVLGPKGSGKTSLIKSLTKNKVLPDPLVDNLNISYLKEKDKKIQIVDGALGNIKEFKKMNCKGIICVFDPSPNSIPLEEQIRYFKKIKKSFRGKIFAVANKVDVADGKKLDNLRDEIKEFNKVSAKTGDGLEKLKKDIISLV